MAWRRLTQGSEDEADNRPVRWSPQLVKRRPRRTALGRKGGCRISTPHRPPRGPERGAIAGVGRLGRVSARRPHRALGAVRGGLYLYAPSARNLSASAIQLVM